MTDDQLFGEVDLEQEVIDLKNEIKFLRSFLVEKNLAEEYILWKLERKLELKTEEVEYLKRMMVKWGMVEDE